MEIINSQEGQNRSRNYLPRVFLEVHSDFAPLVVKSHTQPAGMLNDRFPGFPPCVEHWRDFFRSPPKKVKSLALPGVIVTEISLKTCQKFAFSSRVLYWDEYDSEMPPLFSCCNLTVHSDCFAVLLLITMIGRQGSEMESFLGCEPLSHLLFKYSRECSLFEHG